MTRSAEAPEPLPTSIRQLLDGGWVASVPPEVERLEFADRARLRELPDDERAWDRQRALHLTASAYVVHPPSRRVLLRWHERQGAWIQVGGHGDPGESDPVAIAVREGREETGLDDLRPWPDGRLLQAVIVPVPAHGDEPAHEHGDLRFVLATDQPDRIVAESASAPLRWLSLDQAAELCSEANVVEGLRRVGELLERTGR